MSNNDDFDFNRDDLFDDFDDDDSGGDDFSSEDFDFGDESDDFNIDDDDFGSDLDSALADDDDMGGGDDDDFDTAESGSSGGGSNRNFIIAVVAMLLVFLVGIGLIVFLVLRGDPQQEAFLATSAAIETENALRSTQIAASATAGIENATSTQAAIETATAQFTPPTSTPTETLTPTEDLTATAIELENQQIAIQQTAAAQIAIDATNTEVAFQLTLNPDFQAATTEAPIVTAEGSPEGGTPVSLSDVQQTATALALLFAATPTQSSVQPTDILQGTPVVIGGGTPTGTSTSGQGGGDELPDTGLFDDVFQGNPAMIFLAAFGLLGVIVVSRSVRGRKRHDD